MLIDLEQFFPSIDHAILLKLLSRKIKDERVLDLTRNILASGTGVLSQAYDIFWFAGDDLLAALRPRGLLIDNLTSQFLAKVVLTPLDHFITRELRCDTYIRYVDDGVIFADSPAMLAHHLNEIMRHLERFRLTLHTGAQPRPVDGGIPFLDCCY